MSYAKYHNIQSFSDQQQDVFVIACTQGKQNGTYLEIGGGHPIYGNNTFVLEQQFGWTGIAFEMNPMKVNEYNLVRRNRCLIADATTVPYNALLEKLNAGTHVDFLQVDIDPPHNTLAALKQIDFNKVAFSIVTFEHDGYMYPRLMEEFGDLEYVRTESREILQQYGYVPVILNVVEGSINSESGLPHGPFEDWYVHPDHIGNDVWKQFVGENVPMNYGSCSPQTKELFNSLLAGYELV